MSNPTIKPLADRVLVEPLEAETKTASGIIIPDTAKEKPQKGTVIAVGPGKYTLSGELMPTQVKVGDLVVLPTMGFTKLPFDGEEYYVGPENSILAKVVEQVEVQDILNETELSEEDLENLSDI